LELPQRLAVHLFTMQAVAVAVLIQDKLLVQVVLVVVVQVATQIVQALQAQQTLAVVVVQVLTLARWHLLAVLAVAV
jgi:hypothetical protein